MVTTGYCTSTTGKSSEAASGKSNDNIGTAVSTDGWEANVQLHQGVDDEVSDDASNLDPVFTGSNPQADFNLYCHHPNRPWCYALEGQRHISCQLACNTKTLTLQYDAHDMTYPRLQHYG